MDMVVSRVRSLRAVSALAAAVGVGPLTLAGLAPTLISSGGSITHTAGFSASQRSVALNALPSFPSLGAAAVPLQLPLGALVNGATNTTAKAGVGVVTSEGFMGVILATGTSLTQKGNLNADANTASGLTISFSATWQLNSPTASAPPAMAGASFTVAGSLPANPPPGPNLPSPTAFFQLGILGCQFDYTTPIGGSGSFRAPINNPNFLFTNIQGAYALNASDVTAAIPSTLPAGTLVTLSGTFQFRLHNDGEEAGLDAVRGSGTAGPGNEDFLASTTPAPGAAATLALGGLVASRRRRA